MKRTVDDPEFQAKAKEMFAPLRYLPPADYAKELAAGEVEFQQLWKDAPWLDK
ncbi:hypothetical protein D3C85_1935990 [compost metagenome]